MLISKFHEPKDFTYGQSSPDVYLQPILDKTIFSVRKGKMKTEGILSDDYLPFLLIFLRYFILTDKV